MDTTNEMLPAEGPGPNTGADGDPPVLARRRMPRWLRRTTWSTGLVLSVLGALLLAASLVSSGYVAYKPGSATPADDRVEVIGGATAYPPTGDILFLTVSVDRMSKLEKWWFDRNDDVDMVKESVAYPKGRKDATQFNAQLMTQSKSTAELVALQYLGYDVFETTGARIKSVVDGAPAQGHLQAGDTIVAINDTAVASAAAATTQLRSTTPGQSVTLRVESDSGVSRDESIVLGIRPDGELRGYVGVGLEDRILERDPLPIELSIDSGKVGGDSAGLAFTLSIIDELTPGELTGGHRVAVTGTIQTDRTVGPIGGIRQKVAAARKAKAELMLVPAANFDEAIAKAGTSIKVVAVKDLASALAALTDFGGNADQLALGSKPPAN
ncbi:MAG TPA: PDZ domain-containing protein [Acidimicrobiales bacterium]|nr:PDZ domain-containing protein [Acidimicrobiales bacterium]